ncbi:hypothetical protein GKC29_14885 [Micromonospora sp. WMMC415]|uniref:hypothetical protein n=1 Tax=Micromonospora sp. WMMC415 TaxID=2675222 RepID=UPI0012B477FA|nr:hypothetical protein [Micromonospora sp. WMMC415]QGN48003.1 hypothetical protein GKC29_14885 [Micromonospora sp. WMMC415]
MLDPEHGDWVSFAERDHRRRAAANQRRIAASACQVHRAMSAVHGRMPDGWHAVARQHVDGALHTLDVEPAPGQAGVDAIAYLIPPTGGCREWRVRVHNRTRRINFPLYRDGGAQAALFDTAGDALDAAICALRVEIASAAHR